MGRRLKLEPHLTIEELEQRYKSAKSGIERGHYQLIWLLQLGRRTAEVSEVTGYSRAWIYDVVRSYNCEGPEALGDQRQHNQGHGRSLLNDDLQALLYQALQEEPPDGGFWNGRKVADWLSERLGRPVHRQRGWEILKQMEFSLKVPRPEHQHAATEEEQRVWKKNLHGQLETIRTAHPDADVQLWAMDEHRLGLHPILRRVWVDNWCGSLTAPVHCRYEWFWLYDFVHPQSGHTYWWLLPRVNIDLFNRALADFAAHFGIGPKHRVVLVMDQAGWHTSDQVVITEGLHLAFLPPYSPHLQPAERLWPILNEALANRVFETLDDLLDQVEQRCVQLLNLTDSISGLTQFHWWKAFQC